jgi:hypothetical protein
MRSNSQIGELAYGEQTIRVDLLTRDEMVAHDEN